MPIFDDCDLGRLLAYDDTLIYGRATALPPLHTDEAHYIVVTSSRYTRSPAADHVAVLRNAVIE